jgi:hypothetical protein
MVKLLHTEQIGGQVVTIVSVAADTEISTSRSIMDGSVTLRFVEPLEMIEGETVGEGSTDFVE